MEKLFGIGSGFHDDEAHQRYEGSSNIPGLLITEGGAGVSGG